MLSAEVNGFGATALQAQDAGLLPREAEDILERAAKDGFISSQDWRHIFEMVMSRLNYIIYNEFPIPSIPLSLLPQPVLKSQLEPEVNSSPNKPFPRPGSHVVGAVEKENAPPSSPPTPPIPSRASSPNMSALQQLQPPNGTLPPALLASLTFIKRSLERGFSKDAPFTIQRLAEMILRPRQHHRYLHAYLNSLERVVSVVSGASIFPLPSLVQPHGGVTLTNGNGVSSLGSDESLGGALLTPIPWLRRNTTDEPSPKRIRLSITPLDEMDGVGPTSAQSVEHALREQGGVTQGELIRQEQQASDPPAPIPSAAASGHSAVATRANGDMDMSEGVDNEDKPHARGPDGIGLEDTGPQEHSFGLGQILDMEAAVGRPGQGISTIEGTVIPSRDEAEEPIDAEQQDTGRQDSDVIITDADGITEEERGLGTAVADQMGPDAVDTTTR